MEQDDVVCWFIQACAEPLQMIMIGELYPCFMGGSGTTDSEDSDGQTVLETRPFCPLCVSIFQLLNHKFQRVLAQRDGERSV